IERDLRQAGKGYVLGVNSNHWFASWGKPQRVAGTAEEIAKTQRRSDWRRLSAGAGTKGPRLHDWCYLELADLQGEDSNHHSQVLWTRGLLIRRNIANGDLAYFTTWCPAGTSIKTLVSVEGHRWAIEDSFETAKNEFGLDHNESRSWHGWHRHVSLVILAFAMMAAIQHQANKPAPKKTKSRATPKHPISSVGRSRKSAAQLNVSRESAFNPLMSSRGRSGGGLIRPQHKNLISNKNHNCNAKLNACEWAIPRRPDRCDQTTARSTAERWRYPNSGACERSYKYSATGGEYPAKDQHCSQVDATGFDPAAGSGRATAKNP